MFKAAAGVAALLAVATTVSTVSFESDGVRVGASVVKESALQLRETEGGAVLASKDSVESLSGGTAVSVGDGRSITVEPGVRLTRVENGWRLSTHGRATLSLKTASGEISVPSPAVVTASETGWTLATGETLAGTGLAASIPVDAGVTAVADNGTTGGGGDATTDARLRTRRTSAEDPTLTAEAVDQQTILRIGVGDVSPSGTR